MAPPVKTPLESGFVQRVADGISYIVSGRPAWMDPGQPVTPVAGAVDDGTIGRQFDYPAAVNIQQRPKLPEAGIAFEDLRGLADNFDLLRLAIETRKDQIAAQRWFFQLKDPEKRKAGVTDPRIDELTAFFAIPDRQNDWESWLRMIFEDMLVIDAATIYPRMSTGGKIYALEPIDGATIKRVIDAYGRTPMAPDPAYQQILKGLVAVDYTVDELVYRPRNLRTNKIYGYSPVEQVLMTVNIAMRRQLYQLGYFTEGNVPDTLLSVPESWTPKQIAEMQDWWDSVTIGASKRRGRFIPGGVNIHDTKPNAFGTNDQVMNEWLARVVCYAFNLSPTSLVAQVNRATSDSQKEMAEEEGLAPAKNWVKNLIDMLLVKYWGITDIEFSFRIRDEIDPLIQAQIDQVYVSSGVLEVNEIRARMGLDPKKEEAEPKSEPNDGPKEENDEEVIR